MATVQSQIPNLDLAPEIDSLGDELEAAISQVVRSGRYILGPQVAAFEEEVASYLHVRHAVGCNSGTDALVIGLRALDIGPGDEVITTPFTFFATAEAISTVGARPVFVDIDPATFNIDPAQIEAAVSPRTKAVLPVHLFGQSADMSAILDIAAERGLLVLEDAAQAFGALHKGSRIGALGKAAALSFFPSKNLGALGDAGMLVTDDDRLAETARMLRTHGSLRKYHNQVLGYNSRLDEVQAAVLRVKLPHIDRWNERRRRAARLYDALLSDVAWLKTPSAADYAHHVYHQYTIRVIDRKREDVAARLREAGVQVMVYYPVAVHRLPVYADTHSAALPRAEQAAREVLSLPMGPWLRDETIHYICDVIKSL